MELLEGFYFVIWVHREFQVPGVLLVVEVFEFLHQMTNLAAYLYRVEVQWWKMLVQWWEVSV